MFIITIYRVNVYLKSPYRQTWDILTNVHKRRLHIHQGGFLRPGFHPRITYLDVDMVWQGAEVSPWSGGSLAAAGFVGLLADKRGTLHEAVRESGGWARRRLAHMVQGWRLPSRARPSTYRTREKFSFIALIREIIKSFDNESANIAATISSLHFNINGTWMLLIHTNRNVYRHSNLHLHSIHQT